jgi:DNA-binding XRE family transcriptional regulator
LDFYKIVLPAGYKYTVTPRLHDSYNSGNGQTYTVDALFSYSLNNTNLWSETYDDVMTSPISMENGGTLYFKVAPYFSGNTGTYLLSVNVTRTTISAIEKVDYDNAINIYPNPAKEFVTIDISQYNGNIEKIDLFNVNGQITKSMKTIQSNNILHVDELSDGFYYLRLQTSQGVLTKKIIVKK